jgi:hypothetical protein
MKPPVRIHSSATAGLVHPGEEWGASLTANLMSGVPRS